MLEVPSMRGPLELLELLDAEASGVSDIFFMVPLYRLLCLSMEPQGPEVDTTTFGWFFEIALPKASIGGRSTFLFPQASSEEEEGDEVSVPALIFSLSLRMRSDCVDSAEVSPHKGGGPSLSELARRGRSEASSSVWRVCAIGAASVVGASARSFSMK